GKERAILKGAAKGSCSLAFRPDGAVVACAGLGSDSQTGETIARLVLWEVPGQKNLGSFTLEEATGTPWVAFSPDGKTLAWGGTRRAAELRNASTGKVRATLDLEGDSKNFLLQGGTFSPDGKTLVAASGKLKLW